MKKSCQLVLNVPIIIKYDDPRLSHERPFYPCKLQAADVIITHTITRMTILITNCFYESLKYCRR
jgi:hypothetical protein